MSIYIAQVQPPTKPQLAPKAQPAEDALYLKFEKQIAADHDLIVAYLESDNRDESQALRQQLQAKYPVFQELTVLGKGGTHLACVILGIISGGKVIFVTVSRQEYYRQPAGPKTGIFFSEFQENKLGEEAPPQPQPYHRIPAKNPSVIKPYLKQP